MAENYESILRKSLDDVDRRLKWAKTIAVTAIALACVNAGLGMANLHDMRLLYIVTYLGMVFWTGGLAIAILGVSNGNTQLILKAIALVSEAAGKTSAHPEQETLGKRVG